MSATSSSRLRGSVGGKRPLLAADYGAAPVARPLTWVGHLFVWLWVFAGFFVLREPSPYELIGVAVIGTAFMFGLAIPRAALPLVGLLMLYVIGGFMSVPIAPDFERARFQITVTAFLAATSLFFACYLARDTVSRLNLISNGWQWGAIFASLLGLIGYFNVAGTAELFTLYGRARGSFEDPNVYGPYLTGAVVFAIYAILSRPMSRWLFPLLVVGICSLAILLSFSRGAWGYTIYATGVIAVLHFILTPNPAERLRIIALSVAGMGVLVLGLGVALSIPEIRELFTVRASLIQNYDGGELGRFGRHVLGFQMSMHHPFGIGAFGFAEIFSNDPHNVYLNALLVHGWLGFFAYMTLVLMTVYQLIRVILFNPPLRAAAVPVFALFTGIMLVGTFIDTDRWRHFFLLLGLSWGIIAASIANPFRPRQGLDTPVSESQNSAA